jgi:pimeloyl-ACP methyl ester carboxylesterase
MFKKLLLAGISVLSASTFLATCAPTDESGGGHLGTGLSASAPAPGSLFLYPERIPLQDGGFFTADRGTIFVPVNRSDPGSGILALEVYRFKASEAADPNTPPIFFLHGGPSFQGLEAELGELGTFEEKWRPFLDVSDLVVLSQRGIGPSKPTTTMDITLAPEPLDEDLDQAKMVEEFQALLVSEREAWTSRGLDLSGFTIIEAAADVDDLRQALGYDKVTLWGGSFGSHWGMAVLRYYPETVERVVFRGMEGPDHTYDHPGHIWNVYKRVAEEAEAAPEFQGLIPEGGLITAINQVMERLRTDPFTVTVPHPETGVPTEVRFSKESAAGEGLARGFSGGLPSWPADVIALANGDFIGAAQRAIRQRDSHDRSYRTASYFSLDCGSGITPERLAEYRADPAVELIGMLGWGYLAGCPVWPSDLGNEFRQNFETDIPAVIAHGTWDTSTPFENALELVPFFTNSKFIPVVRGPHGAIVAARRASEEFDRGILHFAATGDWSLLPDQVEIPGPEWVVPGRR